MSNTTSGGNKKKSSQSQKNYWLRYKTEGLYVKHKRAKMKKQLAQHPNDKRTQRALDSLVYTSTKFCKVQSKNAEESSAL